MIKNQGIEFEQGSTNVFADLGIEEVEELYTRAQIGFHVYQILKEKQLKQREIASLLGISQPDVSHLMNGHFSRFTTDKLLDFLGNAICCFLDDRNPTAKVYGFVFTFGFIGKI